MSKWKFIHNGDAWWLRIEDTEQLMDYIRATDPTRFGESMIRIGNRHLKGESNDTHNHSGVEYALESLWKLTGVPLDVITGKVMIACHDTYWRLLREDGFLNINSVGGCNSFKMDIKATVYRDNLVFPHYTEKDVKIKTWEWEEKKNGVSRPTGYKYHYYAYLGDMQIKDGDQEKWDTYEDALAFAKTFLETSSEN